jgi:hypothetical protein
MTKRTAMNFSVRRLVRKKVWKPDGQWSGPPAYRMVPGYKLEATGELGEEIARFRHERDALYFARKRGSAYDQPELVVFHNNRVIGTDLGKGRGIPVIDGDAMELSPVAELPPPTRPVADGCEPIATNAGDG